MPELPEVETVRRGLEALVVGRRVASVEVGRQRTVRRTSARAVIDGLTGVTITSARRRGKYLIFDLDSGDQMMIHLRMSGRLLMAEAGAARPPHTHVVIGFATGAVSGAADELWFVDPRTFGEVVVFDPVNVDVQLPELARLGIDPIVDGLDATTLAGVISGRSRQLKALLLDQHVIAGIGNIYCDEILHAARLRPLRLANTLTTPQITGLAASISGILSAAIGAGGSTLADTQYVDLFGDWGTFQHEHRVYNRAGQPCLTCERDTIRRTIVGGRSTCWCPTCQR